MGWRIEELATESSAQTFKSPRAMRNSDDIVPEKLHVGYERVLAEGCRVLKMRSLSRIFLEGYRRPFRFSAMNSKRGEHQHLDKRLLAAHMPRAFPVFFPLPRRCCKYASLPGCARPWLTL